MASISLRSIRRLHARPFPRRGGTGVPRPRSHLGETAASAATNEQPLGTFIHPAVIQDTESALYRVDHIGLLSHNQRPLIHNSVDAHTPGFVLSAADVNELSRGDPSPCR